MNPPLCPQFIKVKTVRTVKITPFILFMKRTCTDYSVNVLKVTYFGAIMGISTFNTLIYCLFTGPQSWNGYRFFFYICIYLLLFAHNMQFKKYLCIYSIFLVVLSWKIYLYDKTGRYNVNYFQHIVKKFNLDVI